MDLTHNPEGAGVTPEAESIMKQSKNWHLRSIEVGFVLAAVTSLTAFGCGPEGNGTSTSSSGSGGSGGGSSTVCIDPTTYADVLTISDTGFCVVGSYETDAIKEGAALTWGRHGGPMFAVTVSTPAGAIDLTRLTAPEMATTGKLIKGTNTIPLGLPMGSFFGAQVIDLPFFNWTIISYTNADALNTGAIVVLDGIDSVLTYAINGFYSGAAIGPDEKSGRLFYSGLSPIFKNASNTNALYAAEPCGTADNKPRLVSDNDTTCADSFAVEAFGKYSGPIAVDTTGNVFVVMSTDTDQEARGYSADMVKRGAGTATGTSMFKVPGYGGSLAAVAPDAAGTGVLVFQPQEYDAASMMSQGKDVIAQRFTVEGGVITNKGLAGPMMTPTATGEVLNFTSDDQGRIWVAVKRGSGTAMLVVARKS
jgi:hypothetical protein